MQNLSDRSNTTDRRYLRGILFLLIISTVISGSIATSAAILQGQGNFGAEHVDVLGK